MFQGVRERGGVKRHNLRDGRLRRLLPAEQRRAIRLPAQSVVPHRAYAHAAIGCLGHLFERYIDKQLTDFPITNVYNTFTPCGIYTGKIYITGGFNGRECMSSAEVYDPELNQWTLIAPMRLRRSGVSCIAYHGFVYALGCHQPLQK